MHKVKRSFFDKTDNLKPYSVGESYSHKDEGRIAHLVEKGFLEAKMSEKEPEKEPEKEEKPKRTRKTGG
ncbi:hypothetical protein [Halalkalibacter sp. APA_J-10(15)]|uniref:hypothetical protein n=1 Tax=Halalkalibacter sp. APA_J-10(15) TaxID=2933805 RepID=UPI001FF65A3B|nr:hypothetical protein [Halalkalibacter sp. APA_J-10(15)]MCK0471398.1 hypothetical protein [Halalkalibacter sp. APA_J-10(15)]